MMARGAALLVLIALGAAGPLAAQQTRDEMIRAATRAYQNFETVAALDLLNAALDPSRGPPDSLWGNGVQLLAQILIEQDQASAARAWLRWAFRRSPDLKIDTLNFVPDLVAAARIARDAVRSIPGDQITETSWIWTARGRADTVGRLEIKPSGLAVPVTVLVPGRGLVRSGESIVVPPGSYELQAAGEGYVTARVTREVLPGVTTVLTFNLTRVGPVAQAPPPQATPPPATPARPPVVPMPVAERRKKKFPIAIVLGAVGAGVAVAMLAGGGGGGGGPTTGGITITFPNP